MCSSRTALLSLGKSGLVSSLPDGIDSRDIYYKASTFRSPSHLLHAAAFRKSGTELSVSFYGCLSLLSRHARYLRQQLLLSLCRRRKFSPWRPKFAPSPLPLSTPFHPRKHNSLRGIKRKCACIKYEATQNSPPCSRKRGERGAG